MCRNLCQSLHQVRDPLGDSQVAGIHWGDRKQTARGRTCQNAGAAPLLAASDVDVMHGVHLDMGHQSVTSSWEPVTGAVVSLG